MAPIIQTGDQFDQDDLGRFVNGPQLAYEHLDWFPSHSRLSSESTFCLTLSEQLQAVLSVAPETKDFAWLRFFFTRRDGNHSANFNLLFEQARDWLISRGISRLFSLSHREWFERLLINNGFGVENQLISLVTGQISGTPPALAPDIIIRPMRLSDLPDIFILDKVCFSPPWQLNQASLEKCYLSGGYASLVTVDGTLVAYQVTTRLFDRLHLARLAVHTQERGRSLARALLFDLSAHFEGSNVEAIGVNTQVDNQASLKLYSSLGFEQDGPLIPVYNFELSRVF